MEAHCLRLLLRQPDALYLLDRVLAKAGLSRFSSQDFEQVEHQLLAGVILQSLDQDELDSSQYIQERMPETLKDRMRELLEPIAYGEPTPEKLIEDLIQTVMQLRSVRTHAHVDQLIFMQQDLQQDEGGLRLEDTQGIHEVVLQCAKVLKSVDRIIGQSLQLD